MAAPSVFVSSTFYDLKYIRDNLRYFIATLGYTPVLSEEGAVFYDPRTNVQDSCLTEIPNCQLFVLIIGGRFGSEFKDEGSSITNAEYREAARLRIPIFALVEQGVYADFQVYKRNVGRAEINLTHMIFPNCDDARIFAFIEEVQAQAVNNALGPFRDFGDMESYLRQQWAGMMHSFLTGQSERERVADSLAVMTDINRRIEILSAQILKSVGSSAAQAAAAMYARMLGAQVIHDMTFVGAKPSPADVLEHETLNDCVQALGKRLRVGLDPDEDEDVYSVSGSGDISPARYASDSRQYAHIRRELELVAQQYGVDSTAVRDQEPDPRLAPAPDAGPRDSLARGPLE